MRGKNTPKPIRAWTQAGLSGKLLDLLKKSVFERPLPIQAQAMPIIMSGRCGARPYQIRPRTWHPHMPHFIICNTMCPLLNSPQPFAVHPLPRDCIGIAKTGSGKTLAFVLPMMRHIKDQPPVGPGDGPIGLLMAPTRELVQQISKVTRPSGGDYGRAVSLMLQLFLKKEGRGKG